MALRTAPSPTDVEALRASFELARDVVPELDGVSVTLTPAESETDFFWANLELTTLNDPPLERSYLAYYNTRLFDDPPSGAATAGILVHELKHVLDYTGMDGPTLGEFGIWYATEDVSVYERSTDRFAMDRGCAQGLLEYREWLYAQIDAAAVEQKRRDSITPPRKRGFAADSRP